LATKLKNNEKGMFQASLIIFAIILFCLSLVWLADQVFNGAFYEWFSNRFDIATNYQSYGKIAVVFRNTPYLL